MRDEVTQAICPNSSRGSKATEGSRFPQWLHRPLAIQGQWSQAHALVRELGVATVCRQARCPNLGECWSHGNVSFMILGECCTRRCTFCAVSKGQPAAVDAEEPKRLAEAVMRLGLKYVVVTSVTRDDLADEGSGQFAASVRAIKGRSPHIQVEVLTPDFHAREELLGQVIEAGPNVLSHNVECVERLSPEIRPQASYRESLKSLRLASQMRPKQMKIKSGLMVGLGETPDEVTRTMVDLRESGCGILTIGQYLQPTPAQRPVADFIDLKTFDAYRRQGEALGFEFVASAPYVRSSYNAFEALS